MSKSNLHLLSDGKRTVKIHNQHFSEQSTNQFTSLDVGTLSLPGKPSFDQGKYNTIEAEDKRVSSGASQKFHRGGNWDHVTSIV